MSNVKVVLEWTYPLQLLLEKMSQEEFEEYMADKVIKYNGELYGLDKQEIEQ